MWLCCAGTNHLALAMGVLGGALLASTPTLTTPRQVTNQCGPLEKSLHSLEDCSTAMIGWNLEPQVIRYAQD